MFIIFKINQFYLNIIIIYFMDNINNDGYLILKDVLTPEQLQNGLNSDRNGIIDYKIMRDFIDNDFISTIVANTSFIKNPTYIKFRYSNNNNSTDASTFHSDIYDFTDNEIMPIYTCLCYFDKTQMEVIPGSHKRQFHNENSSISSYNKKRLLTIEPGDIVIFHANMYHRGTNFNTNGNRRLLQVFEVFPDNETYLYNSDKLLTVITANTSTLGIVNNLSYYISKIPFIIDNICFPHYFLVYNNLQYKMALNDLAPWDKSDKLITYEPGKRMTYESITGMDPINTNIICQNTKTTEPGYFYIFTYIIYWILSFYIFYYIGRWLYKISYFRNILKKSSKIFRKR